MILRKKERNISGEHDEAIFSGESELILKAIGGVEINKGIIVNRYQPQKGNYNDYSVPKRHDIDKNITVLLLHT